MVKEKIDNKVLTAAYAFVEEVKKYYNVDYAILFGSFAKGSQHVDSDIDIAIVSNDIKNTFFDRIKMTQFTWDVDLRIEPHPILTDDFRQNASPLVNEILKTGVQLYAT